jgi:hypothetical protein
LSENHSGGENIRLHCIASQYDCLQISVEIIEVRQALRMADKAQLAESIQDFCDSRVWEKAGHKKEFLHLRITNGAFPEMTEAHLGRYLAEVGKINDETLRRMLTFAAMCILESISFTRKDGRKASKTSELRWDW